MKKFFLLFALTANLALFSFEANAQTTNITINSASLEFVGTIGSFTSFSMSGNQVSVPNTTSIREAYYPNAQRCAICFTGDLLQLSWNNPGDTLISGPATVNGVNYNRLYLSTLSEGYGPSSHFKYTVSDIIVPYMPFRRPAVITVPARLQGRVYAFLQNPDIQFPSPPVFVSDIDIQGTMTIELAQGQEGNVFRRAYYTRKITFNFVSNTPNSEKQ